MYIRKSDANTHIQECVCMSVRFVIWLYNVSGPHLCSQQEVDELQRGIFYPAGVRSKLHRDRMSNSTRLVAVFVVEWSQQLCFGGWDWARGCELSLPEIKASV